MRALVVILVLSSACAGTPEPPHQDPMDSGVPYAVEVVDVTYGTGAGHGQDEMAGAVVGPPSGGSTSEGSTQVLSLGKGGVITLRMGMDIVDGEGPDFIVFENAFYVSGTMNVYAEPGQVSVSDDGVTFVDFPCDSSMRPWTGCAGITPTLAPGEDGSISATDVNEAGGDAFDLAVVGLPRARFVRVTDRSSENAFRPTAGFDLDAVAVVLTRQAN